MKIMDKTIQVINCRDLVSAFAVVASTLHFDDREQNFIVGQEQCEHCCLKTVFSTDRLERLQFSFVKLPGRN